MPVDLHFQFKLRRHSHAKYLAFNLQSLTSDTSDTSDA